jgi:hypothetical protein
MQFKKTTTMNEQTDAISIRLVALTGSRPFGAVQTADYMFSL